MDPEGQRGAPPRLLVLVGDERGGRVAVPGLASWLRRVAPARARGVLSVALVTDARMRTLNRRYRGRDRATDVLSFALDPPPAIRGDGARHRLLGDVVIARGVARRQAAAAGHSELTELRVLALHGLLHVLGYDHERDDGRMRKLERRLLGKGGVKQGLVGRAPAAVPRQQHGIAGAGRT